eukprot:12846585-Prorocentrum_lima.AAC.1
METKELPVWCDPILHGNLPDVLFNRGQSDFNWQGVGCNPCMSNLFPESRSLAVSWSVPPILPA